jgi:hypothetical protein
LGVGDRKTEILFEDFGPGYSAFNTASPEGASLKRSSKKIVVDMIDLDGYFKDKKITPTFIKIDAEGYEKNILDGMKETISANDRPLISLEMANESLWARNYKDAADELIKHGFRAYEMRDDGYIFPCTIKDTYIYDNILFVPKEKEVRIKDLIK